MVTENVLLIVVISVMVAVLVGPCYSNSDDGRYSRSANEAKIPSAGSHRQFRIAKLEQIWTKAHRMGLSPVRLAELHADLRLYEVEHLAWKHSAEREEKPSPDFKLHAILGRYGLDGRKRDAEIFTNRVADNWDGSTEGEIVFADPKLEKLWMKAHNSHRFDHEELSWLRKEFEHQQQKMDELRSLSRFLSHMNDAPLNVLESGEQTVSPNYLALQEELQQRNHDVEEGLSRLGKLVFLGYTKDNKFREPSVRELWMKAQIMNLSLPDLQAFENELSKLENLMDKRSHMVQRLQVTGEKLRMSQQSESAAILQEKHMTLLEQTRDLAYKAKKHLQSLSSRLTNTGLRHNEL